MIRQAAPNQNITLMHPDEYSDGIKALAVKYGGEFHNTGYMAGFWADYNTALMRGVNLPFSLEPGAPAASLQEWKYFWGLWQTEGVQSVDYFIHLGDILWNPEIKSDYEAHRKQISLMGQSHFPKAQTAVLYSDREAALTSFPWKSTPNISLGTGYWKWNIGSVLRGYFPCDGLSQSSFANGEADPYRVVLDSNTAMMDPSMVADIEKWVRAGGTFVTIAQTGRSTPERADAWPISGLTGYQVNRIDRIKPNGTVDETGMLKAAPGQTLYGSNWDGVVANGLHMQKVASDAQDLLLWNDGTVAAGMRPLGKGYVVDLGAKFTGDSIDDRLPPTPETPEVQHLRDLVLTVLHWQKIDPEPARLKVNNPLIIFRHGVTNNSLYDTWTLWNQSKDQAQTVSVEMNDDTAAPSFAIDMLDGKRTESKGAPLQDIVLQPVETRVFLTPRGTLSEAPEAWFDLQRKWWRGATAPDSKQLTPPVPHLARDLSEGWKFKTLDSTTSSTPFSAVDFDDHDWKTRSIGIWDVKEEGGQGHGVFRKTFTVPGEWNNGHVSIWITSWNGFSFVDQGRVWLDGAEVKPMDSSAYIAQDVAALSAGSVHTVVAEVQAKGVLAGLRGNCWISYEPTPATTINLAGQWTPSTDGLIYSPPSALPGKYNARFLKRSFFLDQKYHASHGVITVDGDRALNMLLINGALVRREGHLIGERGSLNVTPFLRFGENNEIELVRVNGSGSGEVREVFLGLFDENPF